MDRLKVFLEQYALRNHVKRQSFFDNASIGEPDKRGLLVISGNNVYAPRDKLTWWIDTVAYAIHHATISTTFEDTEVNFTAWYDYNRQGMNYMILTTILIPSKKLEVRLKFYDFIELEGENATGMRFHFPGRSPWFLPAALSGSG